ncbi:hypothetical protein RchiOBHm_Chr5g0052901 [Rosa chinensis]|uniref:Uncharacterized protein n=1 Tax=Rosa chinensis TaxID=74649 RepID=A0A2P6QFR7_ROSCH|nr:hypothetical protein RchiOBHm_Chr5g0052901 [Rosa chinensis]
MIHIYIHPPTVADGRGYTLSPNHQLSDSPSPSTTRHLPAPHHRFLQLPIILSTSTPSPLNYSSSSLTQSSSILHNSRFIGTRESVIPS